MNPTPYLKAIAAFAAAVLTVVVAQLTDNRITPAEWVVIAIATANGVNVFLVPNLPAGIASATKAIVVFVGAILAAVTDQMLSTGFTTPELMMLAVVGLQALLVYLAPNSAPAPSVTRMGQIRG